jgi:phosphoglucosamine mutase
LPTSAVSIAIDRGLADVGVQVTASHNAGSDNGFKVIGARGRKLDDAQIAQVEGWMAADPAPGPIGQVIDASDAVIEAWQAAVNACQIDASLFDGKRIALDLANGSGTRLAHWLVSTFPASWVLVGAGEGTINDKVGSEHPEALCSAVTRQGCVAGIALDGDADRCVLVDERGQRVAGDALIWILAKDMAVSSLAVTVMSNGALEGLLPNVAVQRTPVGDRHLREAMDRHKVVLGGEESGHVLFDDLAGGDGLVTGLRVLAAALAQGCPVSQAFEGYRPLARSQAKIPVGQRPSLEGLPRLQRARADALEQLGQGGRVFLRYSGTEPVLRVLVEGEAAAIGPVMETVLAAAKGDIG